MLGLEYEEDHPFLPAFPYYFYKITCSDDTVKKIYIGKTKDLKSRLAVHKYNSIHSDIKLYQNIRENGGWENWNLTVCHKCICDEPVSICIEVSLINKFKDDGYHVLNCQIATKYPTQKYNIAKCKEHYAIKKECACGWIGSKMEWAHHQRSKRHRLFCIDIYEKSISSNIKE
tara:strand:+ start:1130 stop:1648 length:519 start_codon:yes stop_codon:yes gene_type:complete